MKLNLLPTKRHGGSAKITNETGVILRLISGNENINYCQLRAGEIIRKAVGEILYHWERDYS